MNIHEELKEVRRKIFKEIDNVNSSMLLYEVQYKIALEIINSENSYKKTFNEEYKDHANLLRNYADTFVWLMLNPYTIRELYDKNRSPRLIASMENEFLYILAQARKYAENGRMVIISAITNYINTTDLVICDDPSKPLLITCRRDKVSVKEYSAYVNLYKLPNKLIRNKYFNKVYKESDKEYSWKQVNKVVNNAIKFGSDFEIVDDGDVMWSFKYQNSMPEMPDEIINKIGGYRTIVIGCNLRAIEETELLIAPPSCWPIDFECKFALMEGDIVIMHYIDADCFKEVNDSHCVIKEVICDERTLREDCFVVESNGERKILSSMFLNNVVYGYSTISSMANLICETVKK